jgi:dolichol-phosphate mannosyltransferase
VFDYKSLTRPTKAFPERSRPTQEKLVSAAAALRVLVSIATYNERDNVAPLIQGIHAEVPTADVLVVDDNSPDGTGRLVDEMAAADPRVHALHRAGKLGLGTAILAAMRYALDHDYDLLINMDADFSHHPRYLPALLAGMDKHDVMVGSRYIPGGGTANWPLPRRLMSWGVGTVVRLLLRVPAVVSRGYSFQQEMLWRCHRVGCKIGETPIFFENRRAGASKVNPHEAVRSMGVILYLGLRNFFGYIDDSRSLAFRRMPPAAPASADTTPSRLVEHSVSIGR